MTVWVRALLVSRCWFVCMKCITLCSVVLEYDMDEDDQMGGRRGEI